MRSAIAVGSVLVAVAAADARPLRDDMVVVPATGVQTAFAKTIFLNRCAGGCTVRRGATEDAPTQTSTIPSGGNTFVMSEFAHGDAEWAELVACMKQVWSPYDVVVTDVQPPSTIHYNEGIIAGTPQEIGISPDFGGIAPVMGNCNPVDHAISFTFANTFTDPTERVHVLCWVAAQEIGHTYGLDHSYQLADGRSACIDPMSYRTDCGGQRFFRPGRASCGEFEERASCRCSETQGTHEWLEAVLGTATPTTTATATTTAPAADSSIVQGATVIVQAGATRGIASVELRLNGYPWLVAKGVAFGPTGQPTADYAFTLPPDVPDGVIDIEAIASDDIGTAANAPVVTVTKGAPCESAATCNDGQHCAEGRCFWDPPSGVVGDECAYKEFCVAGTECLTIDGDSRCTVTCRLDSPGFCGDGYECLATTAGDGRCWPVDSGCCSSGRRTPWSATLLAIGVLAAVIRPLRRSRGRRSTRP